MEEKKKVCVIFKFEESSYGIDSSSIHEILELPEFKTFTNFPPYFSGVIDYRGGILSIIDASIALGYQRKNFSLNDILLVLVKDNQFFGLIISQILDIQTVSVADDIPFSQFIPESLSGVPIVNQVARHRDDLIFIIDVESVWKELQALFTKKEHLLKVQHTQPPFDERIAAKDKELFQERARRFSSAGLKPFEQDMVSLTLVKCKDEEYIVESEYIKELCDLQEYAQIPGKGSNIFGFMNLRGDVILLVDANAVLKKGGSDLNKKLQVLVIEAKEGPLGLIVDEILSVIVLHKNQFRDMPISAEGVKDRYVKSTVKFESEVFGLVDVEQIIQLIYSNVSN
jgi:chemotaxis signal transduction protein